MSQRHTVSDLVFKIRLKLLSSAVFKRELLFADTASAVDSAEGRPTNLPDDCNVLSCFVGSHHSSVLLFDSRGVCR